LQDSLSNVRLKRFFRHQIDRHPKQFSKTLFKAYESDKPNWPVALDKKINIAPCLLLPANYQAENADLCNAEFGAQLVPVLSDDPNYVVD
jgi:hypothetical protein